LKVSKVAGSKVKPKRGSNVLKITTHANEVQLIEDQGKQLKMKHLGNTSIHFESYNVNVSFEIVKT